jgi:hypothetical protein
MTSWFSRLPLSLRDRIPESVRRVARFGRHMVERGQPSPAIPAELLADCRLCVSRHEMVKNLPRQARVAEVGTYRGDFARHILNTCDPTELHLIDIDVSQLHVGVTADSRVSIHQGLSRDMLAQLADDRFDWIYIDGDHSYEAVSADARIAAGKVKPGGYLVFNDFAHADPYLGTYGVHRAVVEFAVTRGWRFVWWAYEPNGLYDVALQKPSEG